MRRRCRVRLVASSLVWQITECSVARSAARALTAPHGRWTVGPKPGPPVRVVLCEGRPRGSAPSQTLKPAWRGVAGRGLLLTRCPSIVSRRLRDSAGPNEEPGARPLGFWWIPAAWIAWSNGRPGAQANERVGLDGDWTGPRAGWIRHRFDSEASAQRQTPPLGEGGAGTEDVGGRSGLVEHRGVDHERPVPDEGLPRLSLSDWRGSR